MKVLPTMEKIWRSGDMVGPRRPMARVTIQRPRMRLRSYGLMSTFTDYRASESETKDAHLSVAYPINPNQGRKVTNTYADFLFSALDNPAELTNVKSVSWTRSLDTDTATLSLVLYNSAQRPYFQGPPPNADMDHPGFYTYNYGSVPGLAKRWGHIRNSWAGKLMPDNLIRTYEGYGFDFDVAPEVDNHLVQTGVWMIDTVKMSALGFIEVSARDMGRLLLDHLSAVPVVPAHFYPLSFENWDTKIKVPGKAAGRLATTVLDHSVRPWAIGTTGEGGPGTVPNPELFYGHRPTDVLDDDASSYWLSVGNGSPRARYAYEWVELGLGKTRINQVRFSTVKSGYTAYISVKSGGVWQGGNLIDYHQDGIGRNGSNIAHVATHVVTSEGEQVVTFPEVKGATAVRLTLGNLQYFRTPGVYHYRGGIRSLRCYSTRASQGAANALKVGPAGSNPGRYSDWTDLIKLMCAWGGLFWPKTNLVRRSDGNHYHQTFRVPDPVLGKVNGRVWGDFESTGTSGIYPIGDADINNKTLMDVINVVRDIIGYIFYIDETGAAQWKLPNIYKPGSVLSDAARYLRRPAITLDEKQVLLDLDAVLDSTSLREAIHMSTADGKLTYIAPGYNPNYVGLRRVLTYPEGKFMRNLEDMKTAGSMISVRQLFTYRTDNVVIAGFPGIQIDDQVRLSERVTGEGNYHYVHGISSSNNLDTGSWTYTLQTHWLGEKPETRWVVPKVSLTDAVQAMLAEQADSHHPRREA